MRADTYSQPCQTPEMGFFSGNNYRLLGYI